MIRNWIAGLVLAVGMIGSPNAQPQHKHEGLVGEFYEHWRQPPARDMSCCNKSDCYDTLFRNGGHGQLQFLVRQIISDPFDPIIVRETVEQALINYEWITIPDRLIEDLQSDPLDSPDGQNHICELAHSDGTHAVFCAVRGGGQ